MIRWLKFYFLGFFSNELSKEGAERRFSNTLLSLLLSFVIICCALLAGYCASFSLHYSKADEFKDFLYSAFADGDGKGINLSADGGKLSAEIPDGKECVNSLIGDADFDKNGYRLVLDTRPSSQTFAEFNVICKDSTGKDIGYEAYRNLSSEDRQNISLDVEFSGSALDVTALQADYLAYLEKVSTEGDERYSEEIANAFKGLVKGENYDNDVYTLFIKAYYSDVSLRDSYGEAPTLKTYYLSAKIYEGIDKYAVILDDVCFCSFVTSGGIAVEFSGYYTEVQDGVITAGGMTQTQMRDKLDGFIMQSFNSGSGLNFLVYVISAGRIAGLYLAAILVLALIAFVICKFRKSELCFKYMEMLKMVGSYVLVSSVIAFIATVILSLFLPRGTVFNAAGIIFITVLAVRTAVLVIAELIKEKNKPKTVEE